MEQAQKVVATLLVLFLAGGVVSLLLGQGNITAAVTADSALQRGAPSDFYKGSGLFCYRSYFCQSGIECMYLDDKEPFCSQPAAFDRNLGQKHGEPCFVNINGQVECPFVQNAPQRAVNFEEGQKGLIQTSRGYIG